MADLDVTIKAGTVRGRVAGDTRIWRGIPYAAPPVGPLRLRAPAPVLPWDGVRDATRYGPQCPQTSMGPARFNPPMDENCLTVNVTAPALASPAPRPVLVFVHGGGYTIGSSRSGLYRGDSLVRRGDVLLVTFNYRLGAFGYLDFSAFGTAERPVEGNLGLRDQVAALEWVRDNIAGFGGDPSRVTVFGESAGGNAVTTLLCTPAAAGLFHAAIAQSPAPNLIGSRSEASAAAGLVVAALGGTGRLFEGPATDLVGAAETVLTDGVEGQPGAWGAAPVVDGDYLPAHPLDAFGAGRAHRVPLVIGTNDREGLLFPRFWDILATTPARIEGMFARTDPAALGRVTAAYPGYPGASAAVDLGADSAFWWPSLLVAERHAAYAPTWMYRYDFAPRSLRAARLGGTHGTELPVVFGNGLGALGALGDRRSVRAVSDRLQGNWLSVAHRAAPLPSWPRYGPARTTLVVDTTDRLEDDPRRAKRLAWAGSPA